MLFVRENNVTDKRENMYTSVRLIMHSQILKLESEIVWKLENSWVGFKITSYGMLLMIYL